MQYIEQHPCYAVVKDRAKERWEDAVAFVLEHPEWHEANRRGAWGHWNHQDQCPKRCDECTDDGCPRRERAAGVFLDLVEAYIDRIYAAVWNRDTGACRVLRFTSRIEAEQWWQTMEPARAVGGIDCAIIFYGFDKPSVLSAVPAFVAMAIVMDACGRHLSKWEQRDMIIAAAQRPADATDTIMFFSTMAPASMDSMN